MAFADKALASPCQSLQVNLSQGPTAVRMPESVGPWLACAASLALCSNYV